MQTQSSERALIFSVGDDTLVGVLHPGSPTADLGVMVVVGGPQYRAGSHRQFVQLARHLAATGVPAMRFDVRGMGDSSGAQRSFEQLDVDIGAAIDALVLHVPSIRRVVLWGLCDGASAALLYVHRRHDPRVQGLALLNPWVRTAATQALTTVKHYYRERLLQKAFWLKLLKGGVALQAVRGLFDNVRATRKPGHEPGGGEGYVTTMARAWQDFEGPILLVLSGQDYTAKEFVETTQKDPAWLGQAQKSGVTRLDLPGADHTFAAPGAKLAVHDATVHWLQHAMIFNRSKAQSP